MEEINIPIAAIRQDGDERQLPAPEPTVTFKEFSDCQSIQVTNDEGEAVAQITGYNIKISFNFKYMKKQEDLEALSKAISELAMKLMMEATLARAQELNN